MIAAVISDLIEDLVTYQNKKPELIVLDDTTAGLLTEELFKAANLPLTPKVKLETYMGVTIRTVDSQKQVISVY